MKLTPSGDPYRPPEEVIEEAYRITYASQISFATEALKLLGLANGGAAVALLAYLGSAAGKTPVPNLILPIAFLSFGLAMCVLAFLAPIFVSYLF